MNIIQENIDELNAVLKVKVEANDYLPKVETALKDYQKKVSMPGFRPGKVPAGMIKKMYGKALKVDEINKLLGDSLYHYLNDNKIELLGNPLPKEESEKNIDWDNQQEFEFMYEMALAPKFTVSLSDKDKMVYETVKVDEQLINNTITDVAKRYGKVIQAEVSEDGDFLNGDFVELDVNGEILAGGIFKSSTLFIERLKKETKKQFIGIKKEDKIIVAAPELMIDTDALAVVLGIDKAIAAALNCKLQFTVKGISRLEAAELNQEFFNKIYGEGNVNNEEEFRLKIKNELSSMFVNDSDRKFYNVVVDYLMNKTKITLPTEFLKRYIVKTSEKPVTLESVNTDFDKYAESMKWQLIENKIIKENDIIVTRDEIVEHVKQLIKAQFGQIQQVPMNEEELASTAMRVLENKEEAQKINEQLLGQKVMNVFKSKFTLENKEIAYDEFFKK